MPHFHFPAIEALIEGTNSPDSVIEIAISVDSCSVHLLCGRGIAAARCRGRMEGRAAVFLDLVRLLLGYRADDSLGNCQRDVIDWVFLEWNGR